MYRFKKFCIRYEGACSSAVLMIACLVALGVVFLLLREVALKGVVA